MARRYAKSFPNINVLSDGPKLSKVDTFDMLELNEALKKLENPEGFTDFVREFEEELTLKTPTDKSSSFIDFLATFSKPKIGFVFPSDPKIITSTITRFEKPSDPEIITSTIIQPTVSEQLSNLLKNAITQVKSGLSSVYGYPILPSYFSPIVLDESIHTICLNNIRLDAFKCLILGLIIRSHKIKCLNLANTTLTYLGTSMLCNSIMYSCIETLNLNCSMLGLNRCIDLIIDLIKYKKCKITRLYLDNNNFTEIELSRIVKALKTNRTIQFISLKHNDLTPKFFDDLKETLRFNRKLVEIGLDYRQEFVNQCLERNMQIQQSLQQCILEQIW